jgi:hypothetical protein
MYVCLLEIITDPDLGGCCFSYGRVTETVDEQGRASYAQEMLSAWGNIQPAPGKERVTLEDSERLQAAILIFTPADLTAGGGAARRADRIYYSDNVYRVALAEPWREHAGFTKAVAVLEASDV